jgi:hypothetical protein
MEWPGPGKSCPPSPPFEASAYPQTLTAAAPPMRLTATLRPQRRLVIRTSYGNPVTALEARLYTITVSDDSQSDNFHLTGPGVNKRTGIRFKVRATWTVELRTGSYRYRSDPALEPAGSLRRAARGLTEIVCSTSTRKRENRR